MSRVQVDSANTDADKVAFTMSTEFGLSIAQAAAVNARPEHDEFDANIGADT